MIFLGSEHYDWIFDMPMNQYSWYVMDKHNATAIMWNVSREEN